MKDDPIVEEVHQTRAKLLAEHGGSLTSFLESLKKPTAEEALEEPIRDLEGLQRSFMRLAS
jgi:hypothetical protein